MSMDLYIYVGPYLEVTPKPPAELVEQWEHLIYDGRGENGVDEEVGYLIPNVDIGLDRHTTFSRFSSSTDVVDMWTRANSYREVQLMEEHCKEPAKEFSENGCSSRVKWGVVPSCR